MKDRLISRRSLLLSTGAAAAVGASVVSWKDAKSQGGQDYFRTGLEPSQDEISNAKLVSRPQLFRIALRTLGQYFGPLTSLGLIAYAFYNDQVNENIPSGQTEVISK